MRNKLGRAIAVTMVFNTMLFRLIWIQINCQQPESKEIVYKRNRFRRKDSCLLPLLEKYWDDYCKESRNVCEVEF